MAYNGRDKRQPPQSPPEGNSMKLFHLSDLHLGKRLNGFSLLDDQQYILDEILQFVDSQHPDGILIAGDVYDKPVPPVEAVALLDGFLASLAERGVPVLLISGNHDSPQRLAFGSQLLGQSGVHVAPVYSGRVKPVVLRDGYGPVYCYLLPYLKPAHVRQHFPQERIESYTDALAVAIRAMAPNPSVRNLLVTHQFVTGSQRSESEELSVGGADNVDAAVFAPFDYVALGHLHTPQSAGRPTLRYCGSPLCYSFSEAGTPKSVTVVELGPKGTVEVTSLPLAPLRAMRELQGSYDHLTLLETYRDAPWREDYLRVVLTDPQEIPDAAARLRVIYPNLMQLSYSRRAGAASEAFPLEELPQQTPLELFQGFYERQNGRPMEPQQQAFLEKLMEEIWEEGEPCGR